MPNQTNWIPLRETRLRELYADPAKHSVAEITRRLNDETFGNFSPKAVMGKIERLGISDLREAPLDQWTTESIAFLKDQYSSREQPSYAIIAARISKEFGMNFSRCAVSGKIHRMGLSNRKFDGPRPTVLRKPRKPVDRPARRRAPPREAAPEIRIIHLEPRAPGMTIVDLSHGGCRFPYGDGPFTFCDHPQVAGSSYCRNHYFICRGVGTASERAAAKVSAAA
jgi:GcrA cell cycle regulator